MANISENYGTLSYNGLDAGSLIGREIIKGHSLSQGIFTIRQNIKGVGLMRTFTFDEGDLQSGATCGFTAQGGVLAAKSLTLVPLKANVEACKADFNIDFAANNMEAGQSGGLDAEAVGVITAEILRAVSLRVDKDIWASIKVEALADADVPKVTIGVTTVANILDEIGKVYDKLATVEGFDANSAFIAVSPQDKALYEQALAKAGAMPAFYLGEKGTNFLGVRIVSVIGVIKGDMYASFSDNMFYMTDLDSDRNTVAIKDMDESDLSGNIRFKALWSAGASYAYGERLIYAHV